MHILVEHRVPLILWSAYQYVAVLVLLHVVHIRAYLYMKYMYSRSSYVLFVTCNVYMYIVKLVEHRVPVSSWSAYQYVAVLAEPVDDQAAGHKVPWPPAHKVPCYSTCARWVGGGSTGSHIQYYR